MLPVMVWRNCWTCWKKDECGLVCGVAWRRWKRIGGGGVVSHVIGVF
jgi:hypothetical protein